MLLYGHANAEETPCGRLRGASNKNTNENEKTTKHIRSQIATLKSFFSEKIELRLLFNQDSIDIFVETQH